MNKYQEALNDIIEAYQELEIRVGNNPDKVKDFDDIATLQELVDKESKYKTLEEELDISLPILFKALKNGIYARDYGWLLVEHFMLKMKEQLHCKPTYRKELRFALKDYKKTWALCEEDLKSE